MFEVNCLDSNGDSLCLYQWDLNQTVTIEMIGCDETYLQYQPEVHFANINSKEAIVVPAKVKEGTVDTIIADIPNILLTEHYPLFVYIYLFTDTTYANDSLGENEVAHRSQATILRTEIPVLRRVRPSDYNYTQNIERFTAEMIVKDATDKVDVIVADAETSINTTKTEAIESIENIKQEVIDEKKSALTAIDGAEDDALTEVEIAKNNAIAELQSAADDTYVNKTDICYDLDSYTAEDNDGKVLSASEGVELIKMIEEKTDYFGLCYTDAETQTKVVEVATDNIALKKGTILHVRFSHENTSSKPKLSVNATPAISIQASGTEGAYWQAHQMVTFVYDDQSDMGSDVGPVWQVVSSPVYTNGDVIGNAAEKHIVLTDSDVNDQMRFNYGDVTKMYLDSLGMHIGEDNKLYDEYGAVINNGVPVQKGSEDPNTTTEHLILTNHANAAINDEDGEAYYMYVLTFFENKNEGGMNKAQVAVPFGQTGSVYHRYYANSVWSEWRRHINEDEVDEFLANYNNFIKYYHNSCDVVNKKGYNTNPEGPYRSIRLVWDSPYYFFRPNHSAEGLVDGEIHLGCETYPFRNTHTKFLRVYGSTGETGNPTAAIINGTMSVIGITTVSARIQPYDDAQVYLGKSNARWICVYAKEGTVTTSDLNKKTNISNILSDERYIKLFDLIQPYSYMFVNQDGDEHIHDRIHTGFISQYVEEAMEKVGLTADELSFFCKDQRVDVIRDEDGNVVDEKLVVDEDGNPVYDYSLRYEEYIAIMSAKIKHMEKKHEEEITSLQRQIDELKAIVLNK